MVPSPLNYFRAQLISVLSSCEVGDEWLDSHACSEQFVPEDDDDASAVVPDERDADASKIFDSLVKAASSKGQPKGRATDLTQSLQTKLYSVALSILEFFN